jgi:hypothetical protein
MPANLVERTSRRRPRDVILGLSTLLISAASVIAGLASAGSLLWSALK